ncbi:MAG: hypothetical protein ACK5LJ_06595 [Paracoccus sp. (in: a-proteobacteria)]
MTEILTILDARSFSSPWFWLVLITVWTLSGRHVLGVPGDVLAGASRALREAEGGGPVLPDEAALLLDWLLLNLPRWRIARIEGAVFCGVIAFIATVLMVLGFGFGLEMAQALSLILLPQALLLALRLRLACRLSPMLEAARQGEIPPAEAAAQMLRRIGGYRIVQMVVSVLALVVTLFWASLWMMLHPNGL